MTETIAKIDRETFEILLPWYVSGRLDENEKRQVREFLKENPQFEVQLALIEEEQTETVRSNEMLGSPSFGALDRLMQDIAAEKRKTRSWLPRFNSFVEPAMGWLGDLRPLAMAAAVAVIVIQTAVIGIFISGQSETGSKYKTASGPDIQETLKGSYVFIGFSDNLTVSDMTGFLESLQARVVSGPEPNGMYRVRVSERKLPQTELAEIVSRLKGNQKIVKSVFPAD